MKKLAPSCNAFAVPLLLSALMSGVVSCISTLRGLGASPGFVGHWMSAWSVSWPAAFLTAVVALPIVRRIASAFVEPPGPPG